MEIACKIPLKSEICCKNGVKFEGKSEGFRKNGANPRLKCDENDEMMMIFYEMEHKSVRKSEKSEGNVHKSVIIQVKLAGNLINL